MIKGIIFDMDGVIVDTEWSYQQRRRDFMESLGYLLDGIDLCRFIGESFRSLWDEVEPRVDISLAELESAYEDYKAKHPLSYKEVLFQEAKELIQTLHQEGYRLALASSSVKPDIERCLQETELAPYFDVVLSGRDFPKTKPSPLVYEEACRLLQLPKEEIVVLEDSEVGIRAGKAANLYVVAYHNPRYSLNQSEADAIITNHKQLLERIETN